MDKSCRKTRSHSLDAPEGPLVDYLAQFESLLVEQGYPSDTIRRFLLLIADFSVWLKAQHLPVRQVTHASAQRYLRYRSRHRCRRKGNAHALQRFVQMLQHHGVIEQETPVAQSTVEHLVSDYSSYLHQERGLAVTTVKKYVRAARLFLIQQRITNVRALSSLSALRVIRFVQSKGAGRSSCDRRSAVGRRDYAMLLLLARLGLRAGEVASLTLDDIDWHAGTLTVHGKGSQESPLPLLEPIGKAIAAYLKRGRPHCKSRRVFLRMHAPIRGFKTEKPVSTAVG